MNKLLSSFCIFAIGAIALSSCCEPKQKNSIPQVIDSSYVGFAVKDINPLLQAAGVLNDSGYYPVYQFAIKNVGSDADTFVVQFARNGYSFSDTGFVPPGASTIFRNRGPLADTAVPSAQSLYVGFFVSTTDSVQLNVLQPTITIYYGAIYNGPEGCNSNSETMQVDPNALN